MLRDLLFKTESDKKYLADLEAILAGSEAPNDILCPSVREAMGDRAYYATVSEMCRRGRPVREAARQIKERALCLHLTGGR